MTYLRVIVAIAVVAGATAFSPAPLPKTERRRATDDAVLLQGTYKVLDYGRPNVNVNGRLMLRRTNMKVRISGKQFQFLNQSGNDYVPSTTYEMKLSQRSSPKVLDMTYKGGDYTATMKGIYKIEGSKVTVAFVTSYTGVVKQIQEPERPTSFDNLPPSAMLMVLQRE